MEKTISKTSARQPRKLGLVFSGGGARGAYQIGVWKALKEFGMAANIEAVAGTSVGSLNGALFVQGDIDVAENLWCSLSKDSVMSLNSADLYRTVGLMSASFLLPHTLLPRLILLLGKMATSQGLMSQDGLKKLIQQSGACQTVSGPSLPFHVCALRVGGIGFDTALVYQKLNALDPARIADWMLASSAIPLLFDSVDIDGRPHCDGGVLPGAYQFSDNTPFRALIENESCTHIINVFLDRSPDPEILRRQKEQYRGVRFWNIFPQQDFGSGITALKFDGAYARDLIERGYRDTCLVLKQFDGFRKDEDRFMDAIFSLDESDKRFVEGITENQSIRAEKPRDSATLDELMQQLTQRLGQQEAELIDSGLDKLIEESGENSVELLDEAFASITARASTEGRIQNQLDQGFLGRLWGACTGSNAKHQARINQDLNLAIYASQQLIQKLNRKHVLTMEVLVHHSNKINYLLTHVSRLEVGQQQLELRMLDSLNLFRQVIARFSTECERRFAEVDQRLVDQERHLWMYRWQQKIGAMDLPESPWQALLSITASFYTESGRDWDEWEIHGYKNALKLCGLKQPLMAGPLVMDAAVPGILDSIGASHIYPLSMAMRRRSPLLLAMQLHYENRDNPTRNDICAQAEAECGLSLAAMISPWELGQELLHGWRMQDRRKPVRRTTRTTQAALGHEDLSRAQATLLESMTQAIHLLKSVSGESTDLANLEFLREKAEKFRVIVPVIGKFSSGKSTLLNRYLGDAILPTDIAPETAFATELRFAEAGEEKLQAQYLDGRTVHIHGGLKALAPSEDLAYAQLFIRNARLSLRRKLVLVDMPGFDARNQAHHRAVARYLAMGNVFVCLFPATAVYDHSVIERLEEIHLDYGRDVVCLISKAGRVTTSALQESRTQLEEMLASALGGPIHVGAVESISEDSSVTLRDFEDALDSISGRYDELMLASIMPALDGELASHAARLDRNIRLASITDTQLQEQIDTLRAGVTKQAAQLEQRLEKLRYNLGPAAREALSRRTLDVLNGHESRLVAAARNHTMNEEVLALLRPALQNEMHSIIESELAELEKDVAKPAIDGSYCSSFHLPPEEKEVFSFTFAGIAAGLGFFVAGPIGSAIAGFLGGLLGRSDNEEARTQAIRAQIRDRVIPDIVQKVIAHVGAQLDAATQDFTKKLKKKFGDEQVRLTADLTTKQEEMRKNTAERQQLLERDQKAVVELADIRARLGGLWNPSSVSDGTATAAFPVEEMATTSTS